MREFDEQPSHYETYDQSYVSLPVAEVPWQGDDEKPPEAGSAAWRLSAHAYDDDLPDHIAECFDWFFEHIDTSQVTAVVIGGWEEPYDGDSSHLVRRLADEAGRLPELRSLFLGAMSPEDCEISWITQSDITPLLEAYPKLERLEVRGGTGLRFSPVRHESLKVLRFETGGLPGEAVRGVGACDLPALEHLDMWFGVDTYGGDATVGDVAGTLGGERLPRLRHLGLQNSQIQDELAAAVASAPIVAGLETLSLAMGGLTDAGAEALLSGQPLTHLRRLDLSHHDIGPEMRARLTAALPGVDVDLSGPGTGYVAVTE
ncbi:STM4015 family protein [Nonomuraea sp. NPDC049625]|uniref:STM4015 family protein n=1 Tax=Nonomuraea sp. NPDC049625 TaxID=3155775 RepID=UPI0034231C74